MAEIDDDRGYVGCSANESRWKCLNHLTKLLSEGNVQLEELVSQVENSNPLDHDLLKKGKRSPRNKNILIKYPRVKITIKNIFHKTTMIKKPTDEVSESLESLERNPNFFTCKRKEGSESGEGSSSSSRKKIKARIDHIMSFPNLEPTLPETFKNRIVEMGGCLKSLVFVIEKDLFPTDVCTTQARLSVPCRQVKNKFLRSYEVKQLVSKRGIQAVLVQPSLEECRITLKYWESNSMYVLLNGWNKVWHKNALTAGIMIRLWSFRRNSELCFALVRGFDISCVFENE